MTKVICELTGCKYNNSCCTSPSENKECYCTKESINLEVDLEMSQLDCSSFEEGIDKPVECHDCQIEKYGGIKLPKKMTFEETDIKDIKF